MYLRICSNNGIRIIIFYFKKFIISLTSIYIFIFNYYIKGTKSFIKKIIKMIFIFSMSILMKFENIIINKYNFISNILFLHDLKLTCKF